MNVAPADQILQYIAWGLALIEFVLALYVLLLNVWHAANRHVGGLLLLFALNSFALGAMVGATDAIQATWPSYVMAATLPVASPGLFLVTVVLLKPNWLRGRWRWVWWSAYVLILWPILLTLVDARLGTRLWYTGLDAGTYTGGYVPLAELTAGAQSPLLRMLNFRVAPAAVLVTLLYVALLDKQVTRLARRLTWLLLGAQIAVMIVMFGLRNLLAGEVSALIANTIYVLAYAYAAFQQMLSERRAQRVRLQVRLTALILAVTLPLLLGVVTFVGSRAWELIEQDAVERLGVTNRALASNVAVWLDMNIQSLRELVLLPDIVSMDPERQKPILEAMAEAHPHMYLVSTTDLDGINVARNDDQLPKDYHDRLWHIGARNGTPVTFQTLIDRTSGQPALVVSMPIRNESGGIVGVGMFATDLNLVAQGVQASNVGETGFAFVVDAHNNVVAHPDPAVSSELQDFNTYPPVYALRGGERGIITFTDDEGKQWRAYVDELSGYKDARWGVVVQQQEAELLSVLRSTQLVSWAAVGVGVLILAALSWLTVRQVTRPIGALTETATEIAAGDLTRVAPVEGEDEIGILARTFNSMTEQLRTLIGGLEQRVADRTRDLERRARYLEASAQVSRDAASVLELQQLLEQVVSLVSTYFGFYHAGIFLLDQDKEWAVLQAASSEGGQRMLARNHRLKVGEVGIVGYVTGRGEPRVALDVGEDAVYFDNPDMPETRSEMALPLRARGEIIGALDVQSTEPEAFSDEDVEVLQTLADQVAMAISNARLFEQAQEALEAERRAYGELSREAWAEALGRRPGLGYTCDANGVAPVAVSTATRDDGDLPELIVPITMRGQMIGAVRAHKPDDAGEWSPGEVELMEMLTERLGVALESARLYQDTQRSAVRERLTGEITARMRETLDMDTVLKTAAQEVRQALGLPEVVVRLCGSPPSSQAAGDVRGDEPARSDSEERSV